MKRKIINSVTCKERKNDWEKDRGKGIENEGLNEGEKELGIEKAKEREKQEQVDWRQDCSSRERGKGKMKGKGKGRKGERVRTPLAAPDSILDILKLSLTVAL